MNKSTTQFRERLNRRLGEKIFLDAQKDLIERKLDRKRTVPVVATVLSIAILASPFVSIMLGALLIAITFPNVFAIIIGLVMVGIGYILLPNRQRGLEGLSERSKLPATFHLLDQITDRMGTESITHVMITPDFNAFMLHFTGKRVIGIGAVLWRATTPEEKLAILAHEVAHQVNGDPARSGLTGKALQTLEGWLWFLEPDADELLAEIIMYLPFLIVSGLHRLLLRLIFFESQRSEYLADALAAYVAGVPASQSALQKTMLDERIAIERLGMHANRVPGGLALVDRFASAITGISVRERDAIIAKANAAKLAVDSTHPPTVYRIAFLDLLSDADASVFDPDEVRDSDSELEGQFAKQGDNLRREIQIEEGW